MIMTSLPRQSLTHSALSIVAVAFSLIVALAASTTVLDPETIPPDPTDGRSMLEAVAPTP